MKSGSVISCVPAAPSVLKSSTLKKKSSIRARWSEGRPCALLKQFIEQMMPPGDAAVDGDAKVDGGSRYM